MDKRDNKINGQERVMKCEVEVHSSIDFRCENQIVDNQANTMELHRRIYWMRSTQDYDHWSK